MPKTKVTLNLRGIREMKASIPDSALTRIAEPIAARAEAAGEGVAHDGRYPVLVQVVHRPIAGKAVIVSCPLPWALAIESRHGVLARALGAGS
jgi:hypothetical protein